MTAPHPPHMAEVPALLTEGRRHRLLLELEREALPSSSELAAEVHGRRYDPRTDSPQPRRRA